MAAQPHPCSDHPAAINADQGIATVGFTEAVHALRAAGTSRVAIGGIGGRLYGWYFVVFTHHDSGSLLACAGVEQRPA